MPGETWKEVNARANGRRAGAIMNRVAEFDVPKLTGKPVTEWDFEELMRGRTRKANGKFVRGPRPEWITPIVAAEAFRRLQTEGQIKLGAHTLEAIQVMVDLMNSSRVDMVRYMAAKYVLDQVVGLPTQRVQVEESESNIKKMLSAVIRNPDGKLDIVDAEVVGEEEDDDDA